MESLLYLAKDGKVTGPFDSAKVEEMKASGDFYKYEWMWDGKSPEWFPVPRQLHSPPPLPADSTDAGVVIPALPGASAASAPAAQAPTTTQSAPKPAAAASSTAKKTSAAPAAAGGVLCGILFDGRRTLGGEVSGAHGRGAKFISTPSNDVPFSKGANAVVDLLDEATDRSAKVQVNITTVSRMGDRWVLELEWSACPLVAG